jgi:hypothetical protein
MAANAPRTLALCEWPMAWRAGAAAVGTAGAAAPEPAQDESSSAPLQGRVAMPGCGSSGLTCTACSIPAFASVEAQRAHFHQDWHRFNARRTLRGQPAVSESDFDALDDDGTMRALGGAGVSLAQPAPRAANVTSRRRPDVSSLSGSDTDSESDTAEERAQALAARRRPQVAFALAAGDGSEGRQHMLVYKALLAPATTERAGTIDPTSWTARLHTVLAAMAADTWRCAVFMAGGGHFAGAVFDSRRQCIASKTFHRYTTRRKQGGSQSANDQAKGRAAKSAGATLRRYNERALQQEIRDLLTQWRALLAACHCIFLAVPSRQARALFFEGDPQPLAASDDRVRRVPFSTRRPTKAEVERVHQQLVSAVAVAAPAQRSAVAARPDVVETAVPALAPAPSAPAVVAGAIAVAPPQESKLVVDLRQQLQATPGAVEAVTALMARLTASERDDVLARPVLEELCPLQWAALRDDAPLVQALLEAGANPATVAGSYGRPVRIASHCCSDGTGWNERLTDMGMAWRSRAGCRTILPRRRRCATRFDDSWPVTYEIPLSSFCHF